MNAERLAYITVIIAFLIFTLVRCEGEKNARLSAQVEISRLRAEDIAKNARIAAQDTVIKHIKNQRRVDSLKNLEVAKGLKMRNSVLTREIGKLRPVIASQIDSLPDVKKFVSLQDSSSANKDSTIFALETKITTDAKSFQKEISAWSDKFEAKQESADMWEKSAVSATKKLYKAKSRKFGIGAYAGYGIQTVQGEVRAGPTLGIGIQYNFIKF